MIMVNERFLESKYEGQVYDTVTEQDYILIDGHELSRDMLDSLEEEHSRLRVLEDEKRRLICIWANQIDDISELFKQYYDGAYENGDYDVMALLDEMMSEFEFIDSKYIRYR